MSGEGDRPRLKRLRIEGSRSIVSAEIAFTDLDVLIGANGAGKSNVVGFLRMVGFMLSSEGGLSLFVGRAGGASALLHDGPKVTRVIRAEIAIEDDQGYALLQGREAGSDVVFGPGQISDGLLRAMALIALLLQPAATLPPVFAVDEPELGLHPAGLQIVIGLFEAAAQSRQCIVATQSFAFLRALDPGSVIVADRVGRSSTFRRLDSATLEAWLDEYGLDELWDMNKLGGRPGSLAAE